MHRNRSTKIVATLGPASSSKDMIQWLFERGVDIFRLNFSHGSHETHGQNIAWIRSLEGSYSKPIGILADLQGPKLRVGKFESEGVSITAGDPFIFDTSPELGTSHRVQLPHPEIFQAAKKGDELLVDDGKMAFRVDKVTSDHIYTTALLTGRISNHKGLNLPSTHLPIDILTAKDQIDLTFALSKGVDFIALSFVQTPDDVIQARKRITTNAKLIAKIEKPQAIQHLRDILTVTDGVMIARGDLGVELPPERVPPLQRKILKDAAIVQKPVIVATQMLESMIQSPKPTRAEASDVATAVYLGADAVMLSAESASGSYPKEAVEMMDRILFNAEQDRFQTQPNMEIATHSMAEAAIQLASVHKAKAVAALSNSFQAVVTLSTMKPSIPILAITSDMDIYRQLTLLYGVYAVYHDTLPSVSNPSDYRKFVQRIALKEGILTRTSQTLIILTPDQMDANAFSSMHIG